MGKTRNTTVVSLATMRQRVPELDNSADRRAEEAPEIEYYDVDSSFVQQIGYDHQQQYLLITTQSGRKYRWEAPISILSGARTATSVGRYLHRHLLGQYRGQVFNPNSGNWEDTGKNRPD
jgi:hypothetical protein